MKSIRLIMAAIDFSEYSLQSLRFAGRLARDMDAGLVLVNVINKMQVDVLYKIEEECPAFQVKEYLAEEHLDRKQKFRDMIAESGCDDLRTETIILTGHPYEALLACIAERKPDLLVMATKGRSNLIATVIGSCAQKMFRHCPIPLLSIR